MSEGVNGAERIERSITEARRSGRLALVPFLTAGFPDRKGFGDLLDAVARESDLVEIGVPFSDPMADGVTIQRSSRAALEAGVSLAWILDVVAAQRRTAPLVLMSYLNPLLSFGLVSLASAATRAGIAGLIVPDLPHEECLPFRDDLDAAGVALVQLVSPVTPQERLETLCKASRGFVYAVTVTGTTGGNTGAKETMLRYLDRVRAASALPVLAGFGIRAAQQLLGLTGHADGAIVGSALIEVLERGEDPVAFLRGLRSPKGSTS